MHTYGKHVTKRPRYSCDPKDTANRPGEKNKPVYFFNVVGNDETKKNNEPSPNPKQMANQSKLR